MQVLEIIVMYNFVSAFLNTVVASLLWIHITCSAKMVLIAFPKFQV